MNKQSPYLRGFDWLGLAGAISAGVTATSSAVSAGSGVKNYNKIAKVIAKQDEFNEYAAQRNYKRTLELMDKAQEYESPSAIRARYEAAGINPSLAFGSGTGTSAPLLTPDGSDGVSIPDSGYAQPLDPSAIARGGYGVQDAVEKFLDFKNKQIDNKYLEYEKQLGITRSELLNDLTAEEIISTRTSTDIKRQELRIATVNANVAEGTEAFQISNVIKLNQQYDAAIAEINSRTDLNKAKKDESIASISLMKTQETLNSSMAAFYGAQTEETRVKTKQLFLDLGVAQETAPYRIELAGIEAAIAREDLSQEQRESLIKLNELVQSNLDTADYPEAIAHRKEMRVRDRRNKTADTVKKYTGAIHDVCASFGEVSKAVYFGTKSFRNIKTPIPGN